MYTQIWSINGEPNLVQVQLIRKTKSESRCENIKIQKLRCIEVHQPVHSQMHHWPVFKIPQGLPAHTSDRQWMQLPMVHGADGEGHENDES